MSFFFFFFFSLAAILSEFHEKPMKKDGITEKIYAQSFVSKITFFGCTPRF